MNSNKKYLKERFLKYKDFFGFWDRLVNEEVDP